MEVSGAHRTERGPAMRPEGYVKEFTRHSNDVLQNLNELRHRGILTDTTLVVGSVQLQAHCAVLVACRSELHNPRESLRVFSSSWGLWWFFFLKMWSFFHFAVASSTRCIPAGCCFRAAEAAGSSSRPSLSPTRWIHPASPCCSTSCTPPASLWPPALSPECWPWLPTCRWTTWPTRAGTSCSCTGEGPENLLSRKTSWNR